MTSESHPQLYWLWAKCAYVGRQRVNCGVNVWGLTQVLITVANTNPNLTNSTYPPPHTFNSVLVSRIFVILPTATPVSLHPRIFTRAAQAMRG